MAATYVGPRSLGLEIGGPIGMGLWAWGDSATWGYNGYDAATLTRRNISEAYDAALAHKCTLFDTAEVYGAGAFGGWGTSERYLGACLAEHAAAPQKPKPVVVSKYMPLPWRFREPRSLLAALGASVERLGVEFVDVYLIHSPVATLRSLATLAGALEAAVESGQARAVGVSNYSEAEMREAHRILAERGVPLAVNQVEFSLCQTLPEASGLLEACQELGVSLLAYSPLAQGRLTGKYSSAAQPRGSRRFGAHSWDKIQPIVDRLAEVGAAHGGKTPAQVALNWCISKGAIPIPGAKNRTQAEGNAGALGWALSPEEVALLDEVSIEGRLKLGQHG